ncbi:hypothetical protein JYT26_01770, partial [Beggiatoa alba]|nr:hypothetical protein [Beggiatoa alba]
MKGFNKLVFGLIVFLVSGISLSAQINIPLKTWMAVSLDSANAPCLGGCKHMRLAHNPVNGLIYVLGGDHSGSTPGFSQSGRMEMYTYSIETNEWIVEQPYCRTDGTPQPAGPDEIGWMYDSKRNTFWHNPGFNWDHGSNCPNSTVLRNEIMSYDPIAKVWKFENRTNIKEGTGVTPGNARFGQYDPVEDTFVVFVGSKANIYDITNDSWSQVSLSGLSQFGMTGDNYVAMDLENRITYIVENRYIQRIFAYDMDAKSLTDLGPLPSNAAAHKEAQPHWDPINKVVLWPHWVDDENADILNLYV